MPFYVYSCTCGLVKEIIHAMTADVRIVCPDCLEEMTRKPSVGAVTFNGEGWGKDD